MCDKIRREFFLNFIKISSCASVSACKAATILICFVLSNEYRGRISMTTTKKLSARTGFLKKRFQKNLHITLHDHNLLRQVPASAPAADKLLAVAN